MGKPSTTKGFSKNYTLCAGPKGATAGTCDMESRCEGDRRYLCRDACRTFVGPVCYVTCPDNKTVVDCGWPSCSASEKPDCFHHCVPAAWDKDHICDQGHDKWPPVDGYSAWLNCPKLPTTTALYTPNNDGGDCDSTTPLGKCGAPRSCLQILNAKTSSPDGFYVIDVGDGKQCRKLRVYCDMSTDGGGWTKVSRTCVLAPKSRS